MSDGTGHLSKLVWSVADLLRGTSGLPSTGG